MRSRWIVSARSAQTMRLTVTVIIPRCARIFFGVTDPVPSLGIAALSNRKALELAAALISALAGTFGAAGG
jgi:hypothetical protein